MRRKPRYKYRYFIKVNGVTTEQFTNVLETANNSSYYAGREYYIINYNGGEKKVIPDHVMMTNIY